MRTAGVPGQDEPAFAQVQAVSCLSCQAGSFAGTILGRQLLIGPEICGIVAKASRGRVTPEEVVKICI